MSSVSKNFHFENCFKLFTKVFSIMKRAFAAIRNSVTTKYQPSEIEVVRYTSISAFVFLRFFCTAIQNPKIAGIVRMYFSKIFVCCYHLT